MSTTKLFFRSKKKTAGFPTVYQKSKNKVVSIWHYVPFAFKKIFSSVLSHTMHTAYSTTLVYLKQLSPWILSVAFATLPSFDSLLPKLAHHIYLHGFSVGYLTPAGWLYPISLTSTPMYLNTSKRAFPKWPNATAPWCGKPFSMSQ